MSYADGTPDWPDDLWPRDPEPCETCHYVHGASDDTCEYTRACEEADIIQAGDELRVGPGMELDGVDVHELRRRLNLRGIALEANNVGGEPGYRAVRL